MTNQYKDITANIGKAYDNLCQLIGENYTGNPEQVLKFHYNNSIDLFIKPYQGIYTWGCAPKDFKNLNELSFEAHCKLLEDLTPQPKNPNVIETVEELYERVKEASNNKTELRLKHSNGNGEYYSDLITDLSGFVYMTYFTRLEAVIKLGFKVEVVE